MTDEKIPGVSIKKAIIKFHYNGLPVMVSKPNTVTLQSITIAKTNE